jgi:hypothetical protein
MRTVATTLTILVIAACARADADTPTLQAAAGDTAVDDEARRRPAGGDDDRLPYGLPPPPPLSPCPSAHSSTSAGAEVSDPAADTTTTGEGDRDPSDVAQNGGGYRASPMNNIRAPRRNSDAGEDQEGGAKKKWILFGSIGAGVVLLSIAASIIYCAFRRRRASTVSANEPAAAAGTTGDQHMSPFGVVTKKKHASPTSDMVVGTVIKVQPWTEGGGSPYGDEKLPDVKHCSNEEEATMRPTWGVVIIDSDLLPSAVPLDSPTDDRVY